MGPGLRETAVLDAVTRFYSERVFGPDRHAALTADLDTIDDRAAAQRQEQRERLQRVLADLARRQNALLRQAQDGDPNDPFTRGLRGSYNDLETEKNTALTAVAALNAADEAQPGKPHPDDLALLDALPYLRLNLAQAPGPLLRALFETTRLAVHMQDGTDKITISVTLPADDLPAIADAAQNLPGSAPHAAGQDETTGQHGVDAVCAPWQVAFKPCAGGTAVAGDGKTWHQHSRSA